ncbi:MAG: hypothetical protein V3W20_05515, partial [Candidatus Neomarinimicrobiota bacterium]
WWRSGMNWNRFDFSTYGETQGDSVYEHNVRAFEKLYGDTKTAVSSIESQAEDYAGQAYSAGQQVYGAATSVAGAAASQAQAGLDASATDTTKH